MSEGSIKIDLHTHTTRSYDGLTTIEEAFAAIKQRGLDGIAITDHDTIEAAVKALRSKTDVIVIPGIEISTKEGHLLAIGVTEMIPKGLPATETVEKIREAGGLAVVPHPYDFMTGLGETITREINPDAIESVNSNSRPFSRKTSLSKKLAEELQKSQTAGSDAHIPAAIGNAYTIIETNSTDLESLLKAIKNGQTTPIGNPTPIGARIEKLLKQMWR